MPFFTPLFSMSFAVSESLSSEPSPNRWYSSSTVFGTVSLCGPSSVSPAALLPPSPPMRK